MSRRRAELGQETAQKEALIADWTDGTRLCCMPSAFQEDTPKNTMPCDSMVHM